MAAHTLLRSRSLHRQELSRSPTSPRRPLLGAAPAALLVLLFSLMACNDDAMPTRLTVEPPLLAVDASPLVVNSTADPGDGTCDATNCTLREAINSSSAGATITFSEGLTGTINLTSALQLYSDVNITGPGADNLTLDANGSSRGLVVHSTAVISGLTITGGYASSGGGISNEGTLTLSNVVVTGNIVSGQGGGIHSTGTLTVSHSTVSNNTGQQGGGIDNAGVLVVDHSTISGNTASYYSQGVGGGIWAGPNAVTTTVSNSTISGNMAVCRGGGIDNMKLIRIEHTTITGNTVSSSNYSNGCGGGGLASYLDATAGQGAEIVGSIVWGNSGGSGAPDDVADVFAQGTFSSLGHNLIGAAGHGVDFSVDFVTTGDQTGVSDALLGALALNDPGTTATHALLEGSPAIDAGTCTGLDGVTVSDDQRGVARPQGTFCDIGAYETTSGGLVTPDFTFDLTGLGTVTYGDAPFSVADYASSNSTGAITFALSASSVGCTVTSAGMVTITGAAAGTDKCVIEASLAEASPYAAAGPISQSFNIAKTATTASIDNLPTAGEVGGSFTPAYTTTSDGVPSTTSSTIDICTVSGADVSFIAAGTCTLVAHVAEGTNWLAADGDPQSLEVGDAPDFTFDLSRLRQKTYGDDPFSVAARRYVSTNSSGAITFAIGEGSVGCEVSADGTVTITGAAVSNDHCVIEATLAPAAPYGGAGPISQSFNIAKAPTTVSISNLPTAAEVGGKFTPEYTTASDGAPSTTSSTIDICTVTKDGVVEFVAAGTCTLEAHVAAGTNWLAADGEPQSFEVGAVAGPFSSSCTYSVNEKNGQSDITVTWANADPGVTLIIVTDGRDLTKQMTPTPTGSWSVKLNSEPTGYGMWGGSDRKDSSLELVVAGTKCTNPSQY